MSYEQDNNVYKIQRTDEVLRPKKSLSPEKLKNDDWKVL